MQKRTRILLLLILTGITLMSRAQRDTEFWFAAPDNVHQPSTGNIRDRPIYLRITAFEEDANITISQPANPAFTVIEDMIPADNTESYNLESRIDMVECQPANTIVDYGIHIQSSSPVTVYYENASVSNPDIYTLKGRNSIGTSFITPSQTEYDQEYSSSVPNSFYVLATKDNTEVQIIPKKNIVGHNAGVPFTVNLNKGQVYVATATNNTAAFHLGGSQVNANKDVVVVVNDDSADPYSPDLMGDQCIPNNRLGQNYIVMQGNLGGGNSDVHDKVYFFGVENNTHLYRNGNLAAIATIHTGDHHVFEFSDGEESSYFESDKPVLAFHMSGFNGQPGAAVLPPIECTGSSIIAFTRSQVTEYTTEFYVFVFTKSGNEGNFLVNDDPDILVASDFHNVPGTGGDWKAVKKDMSFLSQGQAHKVENTSGLFHLGIIHGNSQRSCRIGFFSNFASLNLGPDIEICLGSTATIDAGPDMESYAWFDYDFPTDTISTEQSITVSDTGKYFCVGTYEMCMPSDTIYVGLREDPVPDLGPDTTVCPGAEVVFSPGTYSAYEWFDGSVNPTYTSNAIQQIWVEVTDEFGCTGRDTVQTLSLPTPTPINIYHD